LQHAGATAAKSAARFVSGRAFTVARASTPRA
jgi:hypothetical protein